MTSKKCLVMNLKLGRTRTPNASLPDKSSTQNRTLKRPPINVINNNLASSPNQNGYFPILPKYTEAAAAFLQNTLAANQAISPFYITPPSILNATSHTINSYSMQQFLEHLQNSSPRRAQILPAHEANAEDGVKLSRPESRSTHSPKEHTLNKSNSSSCGDLVMDEEVVVKKEAEEEKCATDINSNGSDLEAVKRILETVNTSVTKQLLQANMQKFSSDTSDCNSNTSTHSRGELFCTVCKKSFAAQSILEEHDCDSDIKSEGLAAKMEEAMTTKSENDHHAGSVSGTDDDHDFDKTQDRNDEYEIYNENVATTDQLSDDGRKVRVRSLISDEQLKVLKDNYAVNPRPKREELLKIADQIGFPIRVVQVWFQNTRARDRREGRLIQVPYSAPISVRFPPALVPPSSSPYLTHKAYPITSTPPQYISEQPLDLSTKREPVSRDTSPCSSPIRPESANRHSDSGDDAVNLSQRSSRSPTPFARMAHANHYQNSNCSSEPRLTPSPIDFNNGSRLAQILAQPPHKLALPNMGFPMERFMQFGGPDIPVLSQFITGRMSNLSPNSDKRTWSENGDVAHDGFQDEENSKRHKVSQIAVRGLSSPVLSNPEPDAEGQFTCDQCDKAFSKQSSLARHKYEHSGRYS